MIDIIAGVVKIVALILGNSLLAKWIGAARMYWDRKVDPRLKEETQQQYLKLSAEFDKIVKDKGPYS